LLGVPLGEIALLVAAVLIAGVATGILAGLFGIGGGAVIVPVLYEIFRILEVPEEIIIPTAIRSYRTHKTKGAVLYDVLRQWTVPAVVGVATGSVIAYFAPSGFFKIVFMVMVTLIGLKLLFGRDEWQLSDHWPGRMMMSFYGFLIGLISSFMGVSGGSVSNIIQMLYGRSLHSAVATSSGLGVPITIAGTIGFMIAGWPKMALLPPLSIGYVSLIGLVIMAPVSSFTARYGALLAHRLSKRQLEIGFGMFLLLVSARFIVSFF